MATPINEQIIAVIKTRLQAITTGNAYQQTVEAVDRPLRHAAIIPRNYTVTVTNGGEEKNDDLSHDGNPPAIAWNMTVNIDACLSASEADTTAVDTRRNTLAADIEKAVTNATSWWQFGSLAINAEFRSAEPFDADDGSDNWIRKPLIVTYRVSETNPYTVRA